MRTLITLGFISVMFLSSCGSSGLTHISSKQGFSLSYPSDWKAGPDLESGIAFTDKATGGIIVVSRAKTEKTSEDILGWYKEQKTLDNSEITKISGSDATRISYTNTLGELKFIHQDAWVMLKGYMYSIGCTIPEKHKADVISACNTITSSLHIIQ